MITRNEIPTTKCLADRTELYVRSFLAKIDNYDDQSKYKAIAMTRLLRGDEFTIGKNPRSLAAAICYIVLRYLGAREFGRHINQQDISEIAGIGLIGVRDNVKKLNRWINTNYPYHRTLEDALVYERDKIIVE